MLARVQILKRSQFAELVTLFFLHGMAMGMWFVPLSTVLEAHGYRDIRPFAFATSAIAAFVSPLLFGAMADLQAGPVRVLRGLALATAGAMALASTAIRLHWPPGLVLALIQLHALCSSPTWSLSSTIVLGRLTDARRQFGPLRATATFGWMAGCWVVSALAADASPTSGYGGAVTWLLLAAFTWTLPAMTPSRPAERPTLRQRLGLDALGLLRKHDHRVVFITAALFSIPLAAFYPFTPPHLRDLGLQHTAAWMSIGQITEILAMLGLAGLLTHWRLKWIFGAGLAFGVLRYGLCALDGRGWVLSGVFLHGFAFTLFYITAQIYLDERVEPAWRARAQALMSLMGGGVGNLVGFLSTGLWFAVCARDEGGRENWPVFWAGLSVVTAVVFGYFLLAYHGRPQGAARAAD